MIKYFIFAFIASVFFAILQGSPKRAIIISSIIAAFGYILYIFLGGIPGYFFATLIIALLSEVSARVLKMPSSIFLTTAIIPLVPGVGLYQTMLSLVQNNYSDALKMGTNTMLGIGTIAMAIAVNLLFVKLFSSLK